jgi:hypothetical protein
VIDVTHFTDPAPYARAASSEPACRAVVATRLNAPGLEERLLRHHVVDARVALGRVARPIPAGADCYWTLNDPARLDADRLEGYV